MLKIKNISKSFPGLCRPIIKNLSFELKEGDFCILLGANGSGKSTLMKMIAGEYLVDTGMILLNNELPIKYRDLVASVVQDISLGTLQDMTLLENMVLSYIKNRTANFVFYKKHTEKIQDILKNLNFGIDLNKQLDHPIRGLSAGQRQMIAIIMAFLSKPKLLLLDEHTSALDPKMQKQLMEYTANTVKANNLTTIMITHKLDDAIAYGNRLILLHQGCIVLDYNDQEKKNLTIRELLTCFHKFEDQELIARGKE